MAPIIIKRLSAKFGEGFTGHWGPLAFCWSWGSGVFWLRWNTKLLILRAPWDAPLFSERYGYDPKLWSYRGWRMFYRVDAGYPKKAS